MARWQQIWCLPRNLCCCPGLTDDAANGVEGHRAHGAQVVGMDGQHGLPVVGPAVGRAGVAEAITIELWGPGVDDRTDAVALNSHEIT